MHARSVLTLSLSLTVATACATTSDTAPTTTAVAAPSTVTPLTIDATTSSSAEPTTTAAAVSTAPTTTRAPAPPRPDYALADAWICRPEATDVCDEDLAVTDVAPDGTVSSDPYVRADDPPVDCFYAYPTSSVDMATNSDLDAREEALVARVQAGPFSQVCDVYVPVYRSLTLLSLMQAEGSPATPAGDLAPEYMDAWNLAYSDVRAAWEHYLAADNRGRGVILLGHSQGSVHLIRLLRDVIDVDPAQRSLLVGAFLPGASLAVPEGADVGGELQHIPLCRAMEQVGCVVTYASFDATTPPAPESVFGHPWFEFAVDGMVAGCVNPAAPAGGPAVLDSMFESATWALADGSAEIATPLMNLPGLVSGECVEQDGASYLEITVTGDPADPRTDAIPASFSGGDTWGLHSADVALAAGSMIDMAAAQARAYATSPEQTVSFSTSSGETTPLAFADTRISGAVSHTESSGDVEGTFTTALVEMGGTSVALAWFEGRVADCGTGGMAIRTGTRPDLTTGWEIVPGLGTGALATATGAGSVDSAQYSGLVRCRNDADPKVFASGLLTPMPPPGTGISAAVPAHTPQNTTTTAVAPHPGQQSTPPFAVEEVVYDLWTSPQIYLGTRYPLASDTPLRDTMVSLLVFPDVCGAPAVMRVFLDDPLYFEFRGAWDLAPGVNGDRSGAGRLDLSQNSGVFVCG